MATLTRSLFKINSQKYILLGLIATVSVGVFIWPWSQYRYVFETKKLVSRVENGKEGDDRLRHGRSKPELPTGDNTKSRSSRLKHKKQWDVAYDLSEFKSSMQDLQNAYPNALYRCAPSPTGPICRGVHISKETIEKSDVYSATGNGLHRASVGEPANIRISIGNTDPPPLFSVLAVGENHLFTVPPSPIDKSRGYVDFTYTPIFPGEYDLFVEHINGTYQSQVSDSPYRLVIDGSPSVIEDFRKRADTLPSCQTVPQYDHSWVQGEWVSRQFAGRHRGTLRSGWVLQPHHCSFDIFTIEDLQLAALMSKPRTIVVLGRSTERGIFLSLVDIALRKGEKINIAQSKIGKCWGFAEVKLGNLRFIYQDYRIEFANMDTIKDGKHINITCHNEKKVTDNQDYFSDAIGFLQEFLFPNRLWPDVILLTMKDNLQLKLIMKAIPASWKGIIYPMRNFKPFVNKLYTAEGRKEDIEELENFASFDDRIRILDAFAVAEKSRHGTQTAPVIMRSLHYNKWCNELDGEIRVCSDATEMMAQILLGKAVAPEGKDAWLASLSSRHVNTTNPREIQICHDCPAILYPFHIKRKPNPMCYRTTTGLRSRTNKDIQAWNGSLCPKDCMETKPVGQKLTGSGPVDVRICTVLKADGT